ncbi:hypothetical protein PR048_000645 [Dryococelus australis]|uniref:Uncharacterized protein n=1 Tax=Dryococelus australis TaxID=614101 RepID=A0ABQ9IF78_9NEOP|nr:hypothetical protein PR048_000645 [Dryococelus australis]
MGCPAGWSAVARKTFTGPVVHSFLVSENTGIKEREKRELPEKTRRPAASSDTIPTCENPGANPPGIDRTREKQRPRTANLSAMLPILFRAPKVRTCDVLGRKKKKKNELVGDEVSKEHRRNERTWEAGVPRENPPISGIVRRDSRLRKSGSDPAGNQTRFGLGRRRIVWPSHHRGPSTVRATAGRVAQLSLTFVFYSDQHTGELRLSSPEKLVSSHPAAVGGRGTLVVRLFWVRFPAGSLPDFRIWKSHWTIPLVAQFSSGIYPTPPPPGGAFRRYSTLTLFHHLRLSKSPLHSSLNPPPPPIHPTHGVLGLVEYRPFTVTSYISEDLLKFYFHGYSSVSRQPPYLLPIGGMRDIERQPTPKSPENRSKNASWRQKRRCKTHPSGHINASQERGGGTEECPRGAVAWRECSESDDRTDSRAAPRRAGVSFGVAPPRGGSGRNVGRATSTSNARCRTQGGGRPVAPARRRDATWAGRCPSATSSWRRPPVLIAAALGGLR